MLRSSGVSDTSPLGTRREQQKRQHEKYQIFPTCFAFSFAFQEAGLSFRGLTLFHFSGVPTRGLLPRCRSSPLFLFGDIVISS